MSHDQVYYGICKCGLVDKPGHTCMERVLQDERFFAKSIRELARARLKHPGPVHSFHEGYGIIQEEVSEFFDEVRAQKHDKEKILSELIQIAAMCAKIAEDCCGVEVEEPV